MLPSLVVQVVSLSDSGTSYKEFPGKVIQYT